MCKEAQKGLKDAVVGGGELLSFLSNNFNFFLAKSLIEKQELLHFNIFMIQSPTFRDIPLAAFEIKDILIFLW